MTESPPVDERTPEEIKAYLSSLLALGDIFELPVAPETIDRELDALLVAQARPQIEV